MAGGNRKVGKIFLKIDGEQQSAKGNFSYNLGLDKKEGFKGSDGSYASKVIPQLAFIEGEITDSGDFDLKAFMALEDVTVTLELANGKTIVLHNADNASEGTGNTEEGNIPVRFEGELAEEMTA